MHFQQVKVTLPSHLINQAITENQCKTLVCTAQFSLGLSPVRLIPRCCFSIREPDQFQSWRESTKLILQMFKTTKYPLQQYIPNCSTVRQEIIPVSPCLLFYKNLSHNVVYLPNKMNIFWAQRVNATFFHIYFPLDPAWYKICNMYSENTSTDKKDLVFLTLLEPRLLLNLDGHWI